MYLALYTKDQRIRTFGTLDEARAFVAEMGDDWIIVDGDTGRMIE